LAARQAICATVAGWIAARFLPPPQVSGGELLVGTLLLLIVLGPADIWYIKTANQIRDRCDARLSVTVEKRNDFFDWCALQTGQKAIMLLLIGACAWLAHAQAGSWIPWLVLVFLWFVQAGSAWVDLLRLTR
jgi:hypothetical protein